jgi:hypothetical protein
VENVPVVDPSSRYIINAPRVAHQVIDNEAIIIDFESGAYFSVDQTGAQVWELLDRNLSVAELAACLEQQYHRPTDEIQSAIGQFIGQLLEEGLIRPGENNADRLPSTPGSSPASPGLDFQPPVLNKYTDMQDLLLLDPIHEVDERGWPVPK